MRGENEKDLSAQMRRAMFVRLSVGRKQILWTGIAMSAVGVLAIMFPVVSTLSVEIMVGWLLLLAGIVTIFGAFQIHGTGQFFGQLLMGLLNAALGIYLLAHPGVGIVVLTLMLAALFMVEGAWQVGFGLEVRPERGWGWIMLSGVVGVATGLLIAAGLPGTSLFVLGLLVGLNFLTTGLALTLLARSVPAAS